MIDLSGGNLSTVMCGQGRRRPVTLPESFSRGKHYSSSDRYLESPLNVIHMLAFITMSKINTAVIVNVKVN